MLASRTPVARRTRDALAERGGDVLEGREPRTGPLVGSEAGPGARQLGAARLPSDAARPTDATTCRCSPVPARGSPLASRGGVA